MGREAWQASVHGVGHDWVTELDWTELILIPACNSSSMEFLIMCSAYKLNKQSDNR